MFVFEYKMLLILHFFKNNIASFYAIRRKITHKIKNMSNKLSYFLSSKNVNIFLHT
jgi:hypothetical protein